MTMSAAPLASLRLIRTTGGAHPTADLAGSVGIRDVSALFGLTQRAVRYYEQRGLIEVPRDRFQRRRFDTEARVRLQLIGLLRRIGMVLSDIEDVLDAGGPRSRAGADILAEWIASRQDSLQREICNLERAWTLLGEGERGVRAAQANRGASQ